MQNKTITQHSWTLSYRTEGKGFPVMLLHGFAEDGTIWEPQINALRDNYRLLIPDLPGCGQSPMPMDNIAPTNTGNATTLANPGNATSLTHLDHPTGPATPGNLSLEKFADLLITLLDNEEIQQCILIGHSMGGYLTLAVAEKYPHRLIAFGLFHSTAYADSEEKIAGRRKSIEFIRKNGSPAYIRQSTPNLFAESSRKEHPEWIDGLIDRYMTFNPEALIQYQQAMISRPDRTHVLQQFTGPVLFTIGQQDPLIPLQSSLQQTHMPRLSHIHILENAGHMGMLENISASNNILDDFLRPYRSSH